MTDSVTLEEKLAAMKLELEGSRAAYRRMRNQRDIANAKLDKLRELIPVNFSDEHLWERMDAASDILHSEQNDNEQK